MEINKKEIKMKLLLVTMCMALMVGCIPEEKRQEIKDKAHSAIIQYVQTDGKDKAIEYIDKLVAEGKLGKANAEKIKAAIPKGIEHLKKVMGELEEQQ